MQLRAPEMMEQVVHWEMRVQSAAQLPEESRARGWHWLQLVAVLQTKQYWEQAEQELGAELQKYPTSIEQVLEQPSPLRVLLSSQV